MRYKLCRNGGPLWFYPIAIFLAALVRRNYKKRELGKAADRWHWADVMLVTHGYGMK